MFDPMYDSYVGMARSTGAVIRPVRLRLPDFSVPPDELRAAFSASTKLVLVNTPHNPSGKVSSKAAPPRPLPPLEAALGLCPPTRRWSGGSPFAWDREGLPLTVGRAPRRAFLLQVFTQEELELIAELCQQHDVIALCDEVYEHLVSECVRHASGWTRWRGRSPTYRACPSNVRGA